MVVGVCKVSLSIEGTATLKEKRAVLRHIKDKVENKFHCAIAEVGDQDLLQSAEVGFAVVSNELGFVQSLVQKILLCIEDLAVAKVTGDEQDYLNYGDESLEAGKGAHWEPDSAPLVAPSRPKKPTPVPAAKDDLPDWLPSRFLETPDPEEGGKR